MKYQTCRERSWLKFEPISKSYWVDMARKPKGRIQKKIIDPYSPKGEVTKARAIELGDLMVSEWLKKGNYAAEITTFREAAERMKEVVRPENRESTMEFIDRTLGKFLPYLGGLPIASVNEEAWASYIKARRQKRPGACLCKDAIYVNKILTMCHRMGLIGTLPRIKANCKHNPKGKAMPREIYEKLLRHAEGDMPLFLMLAFECGMRRSEILKLEWKRVDFEKGTISLLVEHTKIKRQREFPIPQKILGELQKRKRLGPYVFPKRFDPSKPKTTIQKSWERLQERAKLKETYRIHDNRHGFLSEKLIKEKKNPSLVCKYAGLSLQMAHKVYLHPTREQLKDVIS